MTFPELYLADAAYDALVASLTNTVRLDHDSATDRRVAVVATLDANNPDRSPAESTGGDLTSPAYGSLIDALVTLEPCLGSGEIEPYQVIDALSDAGIWPASVLQVD
jgi:hypothetical protein